MDNAFDLLLAVVACGLPSAALVTVTYLLVSRWRRPADADGAAAQLGRELATLRTEQRNAAARLAAQIAQLQSIVAEQARALGQAPPVFGSGEPPPATGAEPGVAPPAATVLPAGPPAVPPAAAGPAFGPAATPPTAAPAPAPGAEPADVPIAPSTIPPATAPSAAPSAAGAPPRPPAAFPPSSAGRDLEVQLGARLPVWIGAIALALAGTFLVKYAFDNDLLGPEVRVALGIAFGLGLLGAGERWRAGVPRIPAALSAAGIAVLYASFLSASRFYDLISPLAAFVLMALTTAVAVGLSLRQGPLVAAIGMIGGFLAPYLVGPTPDPRPLPLFGYLLLLQVALMAVSRRRGWGPIAGVALAFGLLWVLGWLAGPFEAGDGRWLGLFVVASATAYAVAALGARGHGAWSAGTGERLARAAGIGGVVVMALVTGAEGFGTVEWAYLALLGAGAIVLGRLRPGFAGLPWVVGGVTALVMLGWPQAPLERDPTAARFLGTALAVGGLYAVGGYAAQWGAPRAWPWAALASAAGATYLLVAFVGGPAVGADVPWGAVCLALAVVYMAAAAPIARRRAGLLAGIDGGGRVTAETGARPAAVVGADMATETPGASPSAPAAPARPAADGAPAAAATASVPDAPDAPLSTVRGAAEALALLAAAATFFLAFAVPIELDREWIGVGWALETAAVVWIAGALDVPQLRRLAWPLAALVAARLLANPLVVDYPIGTRPVLYWLLYGYGLPMAAFGLGAYVAAFDGDRRLSRVLQALAFLLGAALIFLQTHHGFHRADFGRLDVAWAEWGMLAAGWIAYAWLAFRAARRWTWADAVLEAGGRGIAAAGLVAALVGAGLFDNPLWTHVAVGARPIANHLLWVYGLPALLTAGAVRAAAPGRFMHREWREAIGAGAFLLVFLMVTLQVRQMAHGTFLDVGPMTLAERYGYSLAWGLLGLLLLAVGVARANRPARYASLAVMMLTVAKVFLYDLANLQDLYRVLSFLGLGVSLLVLAHVYQRFVFREEAP